MASQQEELRRKEELCLHRYQKDCQRIEDEQDDVKRQRRLLQELSEQVFEDTSRAHKILTSYSHIQNRELAVKVCMYQNQIVFTSSDTLRYLEQGQEELARRERTLHSEREDRDRAFREELRRIDSTR